METQTLFIKDLRNLNERPLILTFDTKEKLKTLEERAYYRKAKIHINIKNTSKDNMSRIILKKINEYIKIKDD